MSDVVLEVRNLKTHFHTDEGVVPAVDGVDFTLKKGKTLCVVGESGCGKSVTAYTVMRLIPMPPGKVESGEILYKGKDLVKLTENEMRDIRGNEIAMIFPGADDVTQSCIYDWQSDRGSNCTSSKG